MINQEFLSQCSDDQINKGVAWLKAKNLSYSDLGEMLHYNDEFLFGMYSDPLYYCSNPNDIMPIAFANRIGLDSLFSGKWVALSPSWSSSGIESTTANPLRAICEVYILMNNQEGV
mgnify:FL=1